MKDYAYRQDIESGKEAVFFLRLRHTHMPLYVSGVNPIMRNCTFFLCTHRKDYKNNLVNIAKITSGVMYKNSN